jgi:spermidine dehydrogenase
MARKPDSRTRGIDRADGITRRDFINGMLVAASGAALGGVIPRRAFAQDQEVGVNVPDGSIGLDPRVLRGGNLRSTFTPAHWLRDDRLTFNASSVKLARSPTGVDDYKGTFPILADNGDYEVIVVGSGMAGLAAAFYLTRSRPGTRILLIDGQPVPGGNAGRDDAAPIPVVSGTAGAYAVTPYADFLLDIYGTVGIDWAAHYVPDPHYCYFFDDHTPYVLPGTQGWTLDVYGAGLKDMPYPAEIIQHLQQAKQDFRNWYGRNGSPTDPADNSDPKFDYLAGMTLAEYFAQQGWHPAVADFYTRYAVDALTGTSEQVNAYNSISFLGAEYNPFYTFPGGTSGIARHVLKWLVPGAISGSTTDQIIANPIIASALDVAGNTVRVRQNAMVLRADTGQQSASVVYWSDGQFYRASAKAVILAGQSHTAHRLVEQLLSATQLAAFEEFVLAPVITANVTLNRAAPLVDLGLGYDQYWWGSQYWADFVVSDWISPQRFDRDRQTVLTFYGGNTAPPEDMDSERVKLLTTGFDSYEQSLREDLNRILASEGFDFDRDVSAIYLYRWGHGMIYPKPGFPFGPPQFKNGQVIRTPAPRHIARQQLGRISFAAQDTESSPAIESAIGSGLRTAGEVLGLL